MSTADRDPVARLAQYRLDEDLTFDALAARMAAAGWPVPARALHLALTRRLKTRPLERTLYKITNFVATLDASKAARKGRRRAPAA